MSNDSTRQELMIAEKYLKDLLRQVVSLRAGGKCEFPGCINMQCDPHHWASQKNNATRFNPDCCINLCADHHTAGNVSAHRSPTLFKKIIIENCIRSEEWADNILSIANQVVKDDRYFREFWKEKLLEELRRAREITAW